MLRAVLAIAEVDGMDLPAFREAFGAVVEHSPWVAEAVHGRAPFGSAAGLTLAFTAAIRGADEAQRLQVLQAHPELAGREAQAGELTEASAAEQRAARLDRLDAGPARRPARDQRRLPRALRLPVHLLRARALGRLAADLGPGAARAREPADEARTALAEVDKIVGLRLRGLVAA